MRARLILLAAALLAFGGSLGSGFHFDDYAIFADPVLRSGRGWLDIWNLRQTRPLTYLTFWLNYHAGGYHELNLALHVAAVLLLYECLRRLLPLRAAFIAAALFAVHPIQAEAVNYVWGRSIVLATLLCFASLLAWIKGRSWIAVAWFGAALLAKEECVAFPLVLLLLGKLKHAPPKQANTFQGGAGIQPAIRPIVTMLALALVAGLRVIYATAVTPGAPAGLQAGISPWHYFLAQGIVILRYLRLLVVPYGFTVDPEIHVPSLVIGGLAWVVIGALAWRRKWILAGLLLLLPSSSIFPAADLAADRRMYLPMFAFAAGAGLLLAKVKQRAIAPALISALIVVSIARTQVWRSDETLWREAVQRAPYKVRPKIQLARNVPHLEALALLAEARKLAPDDAGVAEETGKTLLAEGQPAAALAEFGRALALGPRDARNYNNRGVALQALGQTAAARQDFARALAIDPALDEARRNLRSLPEP